MLSKEVPQNRETSLLNIYKIVMVLLRYLILLHFLIGLYLRAISFSFAVIAVISSILAVIFCVAAACS